MQFPGYLMALFSVCSVILVHGSDASLSTVAASTYCCRFFLRWSLLRWIADAYSGSDVDGQTWEGLQVSKICQHIYAHMQSYAYICTLMQSHAYTCTHIDSYSLKVHPPLPPLHILKDTPTYACSSQPCILTQHLLNICISFFLVIIQTILYH